LSRSFNSLLVACSYLRLFSLSDLIKENGNSDTLIEIADVTNQEQVETMVKSVVKQFGGINVVMGATNQGTNGDAGFDEEFKLDWSMTR
jgi:NADP-dependent 3-hydroxy acid dehydrogenase YdfG